MVLKCAVCLWFVCMVVEGSEKKGVALTRTTFLCDDFKHLNVSWWYDWQMDLSYFHEQTSCTDAQIMADKFVPMVWGGHRHINLTSNAPAVLGFNEPNFHSQANLTPAEAVAEWAKLERRSHGRPLVSPAASSCHTTSKCYGDTTEWFDEFFRLCKDCRVDYIATHAYHCHGATTMAYLERLWQRYHRKIWLTEFSCPGTDDHNKQLQYMQELLPLLEAADYVYRYAWYKVRKLDAGHVHQSTSLLHSHTSGLTSLGRYYANFELHGAPIVG